MISKEQFTISIGENISGSPLSIKGYRFSNGTGPSIYIQGGTHGGEITFPLFKMLNTFLTTNTQWSGLVTLIPIAHPLSWGQRSYFYTAGKFNTYDGKDWNRSFPGNTEGSTAERCAALIFNEAEKHDLAIDLHTSRKSKPFVIVAREDLTTYGTTSGVAYTYLAQATSSQHPLTDAIDLVGKKGVTLECGSHDSLDQSDNETSFQAILNMFRIEGLLQDKITPTPHEDHIIFTAYDTYFAPVSGFVEYIHPLEAVLKKGEVLYRIHATDSLEHAIDVIAREDCIIMKYQPAHSALIGDEVVMVIKNS